MRKLTIFFFVILLAGAYTYYWFKKADDFKASIEQAIAGQNTQAKQFDKDITLIRYDGITMSGYPFSMQANISKPVFDVPLSAMLESIPQKGVAQVNAASAPNIVVEISYNDIISFASNLQANAFSLTTPGGNAVKLIVNKQAGKTVTNSSATPVTCHLGIANPDNAPWNLPQSFTDVNAFLLAFRSADCTVSGTVSKYTDSGEMLSSSDFLDFKATSTPVDEANYKIAFVADIKNAKTLPAYDDLINSYMPLIYQVMNTPDNQRNTKINLSQYGTQNAKFDISYEGPFDKKYIVDPSMIMNFDVNAFNIENALYNTDNQVHFSTAVHGNTRETSIRLEANLEATEKYEELLKQGLTEILTDAASAPPAPGLNVTAQIAALGKPADLAAAIVPKLHSIGKISFVTDINLSGDKNKNIADEGDVTINALNLTTNEYGLTIKGSGKTKAGNIPAGDLIATCILCDDMLNNVGDYAINIDSILANARPGQLHYVTKPLVEGIKQFLHAINETASDKNSKNIVVHFIADDKGDITISGKQLLEVIGLFGVNVGQNLQHAAEPAPQTQAAPAQTATPAKPVKKSAK